MKVSKSDIIELIEDEKTDSFTNHLNAILKWGFRPTGEIQKREIRVWRQNVWNGVFYPIFKFHLNNDGYLVKITDRINPVGLIVYILLCAVVSIPWLYWIFDDYDPASHWIQIITWVVFFGIFGLISFKIYQMEKKIQLSQIYEILEIEVEGDKLEDEWGMKKILLRIITYALSFLLIAVCFIFVIPSGNYLIALATLLIVGVYLYSDLKILLKKGKKKQ
ncbi:MAG: hypothetical protein DSY77_15090 [Bacteroidetes bacterium]|uniref:hypothetical protein n=1 Tax=Flagellimonas sp. TaxID=2058762 RepID=UPI001000BA0B|nr:MAG: hypothetical protein DSY77_15090 [Bacteroidota bacterium]